MITHIEYHYIRYHYISLITFFIAIFAFFFYFLLSSLSFSPFLLSSPFSSLRFLSFTPVSLRFLHFRCCYHFITIIIFIIFSFCHFLSYFRHYWYWYYHFLSLLLRHWYWLIRFHIDYYAFRLLRLRFSFDTLSSDIFRLIIIITIIIDTHYFHFLLLIDYFLDDIAITLRSLYYWLY